LTAAGWHSHSLIRQELREGGQQVHHSTERKGPKDFTETFSRAFDAGASKKGGKRKEGEKISEVPNRTWLNRKKKRKHYSPAYIPQRLESRRSNSGKKGGGGGKVWWIVLSSGEGKEKKVSFSMTRIFHLDPDNGKSELGKGEKTPHVPPFEARQGGKGRERTQLEFHSRVRKKGSRKLPSYTDRRKKLRRGRKFPKVIFMLGEGGKNMCTFCAPD